MNIEINVAIAAPLTPNPNFINIGSNNKFRPELNATNIIGVFVFPIALNSSIIIIKIKLNIYPII